MEDKNKTKITPQNETHSFANYFEIFQKSIDDYFKNVSKNTAAYLQSISDLQQEIIESRKKTAESILVFQKFLTEKAKTKSKIPDISAQIISDMAIQTNNAWSFQNQLLTRSIDTLSQHIRAFNENSETLTEMNKELIKSWAQIIKDAQKKSQPQKSGLSTE